MKAAPIIKFRLLDSYMAVVRNSVGTKVFKNMYADVNGVKTDITRNGELSCAFFVSWILSAVSLITDSHATVSGTVKDLRKSGWQELAITTEPPVGAILVWENKDFGNGDMHQHIGFYIGNSNAISNNERLGSPSEHPWQTDERKIEFIFWHPKLD